MEQSSEVILWKAPQVNRQPEKEVHSGFDPKDYPGIGPFFALDRPLAEEWQGIYKNGLQEIHLPRAVFEDLLANGMILEDNVYHPEKV